MKNTIETLQERKTLIVKEIEQLKKSPIFKELKKLQDERTRLTRQMSVVRFRAKQ